MVRSPPSDRHCRRKRPLPGAPRPPLWRRRGGGRQFWCGRGRSSSAHRRKAKSSDSLDHPRVTLAHLDLLREGRSGDQQPLGGPAEVQSLGNREELPHFTQRGIRSAISDGRPRLPTERKPVVASSLVAAHRRVMEARQPERVISPERARRPRCARPRSGRAHRGRGGDQSRPRPDPSQ